jgi:small conductance mechanosensitive channel
MRAAPIVVLCCFAALLIAVGQREAAAQVDERATVRLDGRALFRVGPIEDLDADARRRRVEQRFATLLETPEAVAPAQIQSVADQPNQRIITVSGSPIVAVTEEDAQDNLTTVDALARHWATIVDEALAAALARRLSWWGRFGSEVRAAVAAAFGRLTDSTLKIIPRVLAAVLVLALFWGLAAILRWLVQMIVRRWTGDLTIENLVRQVAFYAVWTLGLVVALDALGFDPQVVATGLGLTSLALGFALKDILSNFVSGILILGMRMFRLGDQIVVGETEGSVERIQLRATQIRTYDGRMVIVPNADLFTSRIVNNTASPIRRGSVSLRVGYDVNLADVVRACQEGAEQAEGVLREPPPHVRFLEMAADGIVVETRYWTDSRRMDYITTQSLVIASIVRRFRERNLPLPQPSERILVPGKLDQWRELANNAGYSLRE